MRIDRALPTNPALTRPAGLEKPAQTGGDFGQMLMDALREVNKTQQDARGLQNDLMANRPVEFHDLMIAMERASTAMSLTLQVRNKLLEAYQEVSRMQV
jgi:flagellar hook-basal body complex protein FliE